MHDTLDQELVKYLKGLFGKSGKLIAAYRQKGATLFEFATVYKEDKDDPPRHPLFPQAEFCGFVDLDTGVIENGESEVSRRSIRWADIGWAILSLVLWVGKLLGWVIVGVVLVLGLFTGGGSVTLAGFGRGRHR